MPEQHLPSGNVIYEVVAFRYSDEQSVMLVGEAEIMIEVFGGGDVPSSALRATAGETVRVDILSAFDPDGNDVFDQVMGNETLKQAIEAAAIEHYVRPPHVPVGLPRRVEW